MDNKYLARIRQTVLDFMADEKTDVYLFGSWARGTQHHGSDVDIAVNYRGAADRKKIAALRELLAESNIPYRVDVVDMQNASPELLAEIRKDGVLWRKYPNG